MAFGLDVTFSAMHIQVKFVGLMVAITDMYRGWLARLMVGRRNLQRQARQEMNRLKKYNFKDDHGHPLENCDDYQTILTALEAAEAERDRLRERLEAALDKTAEIQDEWESEGVCHACGICAGIPYEWQRPDWFCCRVALGLWIEGKPLPWEEAARRAVAESEVGK